MSEKKSLLPLLVTTAHKGVFFGYGSPSDKETIILKQARICVYWATDVKSFMGLASVGPIGQSRVSPSVPSITLRDVTSVTHCTAAAAAKWEE